MEISDFQKHIYNTYLKVLAKNSKRPYSNRKNFNTLNEKTKTVLKRLEQFFNSHKNIDMDRFFQAGFTYLNETFVQLDFFISYKAVVAFRKTHTEQK